MGVEKAGTEGKRPQRRVESRAGLSTFSLAGRFDGSQATHASCMQAQYNECRGHVARVLMLYFGVQPPVCKSGQTASFGNIGVSKKESVLESVLNRPTPILVAIREGELAGAEGFEPSPSSLTVRCPTGWTTPQLRETLLAATTEANERSAGPSAQNTLKDSMPIVSPEALGDVVAYKQ